MKNIISESLKQAISYESYRSRISGSLATAKIEGTDQHDELMHYTLLNETRMNRLEKTVDVLPEIAEKLRSVKNDYTWLVISEGWCGDAAQIVPVLDKLSKAAAIEMKVVFRDEHNGLMDLFLTNGARAIPILIVLEKETLRVMGHWGPRPRGASDLIKRHKAEKGGIDEEAKTDLQLWYLHDKGQSTQAEIAEVMLAIDNQS